MTTVYPSNFDIHLFHEGNLYQAYSLFGAHIESTDEGVYTTFCVWAPYAKQVRLVGSFNDWNGAGYDMERLNDEGIWYLKINKNLEHELYKYEMISPAGLSVLKTDPYAFYTEERPHTAGIVYSLDGYEWNDDEWQMKKRKSVSYDEPMCIYEVHLGTWKRKEDGSLYTYRELADDLIPYVKGQGFTHIEVLPLTEHPFDRSWGYQSTGYFAATSRYGTPKDFMYFVDQCHQYGLGVIMDWVPGHFCKDEHGLHCLDGGYVYEYENDWDRENYIWGTANFDLGKTEVQSFLISNAVYWFDYFHIDGFRVDAVANIIYWPNREELEMNPFGIQFLKKLNQAVFAFEPKALMIAEDSTDWPQVTYPVHDGGLGFNYKWNMGWMNDVLKYMETHWHDRGKYHHLMTFSLMYAHSENFILPFSHDEVVHGKKSLLSKMPGDYWQKFAQLRLLMAYLMAHPGKKLVFMGTELAPFSEWKDLEEIDWHLYEYDMHNKFNVYFRRLLHVYRECASLYELDHTAEGFQWIDVHNAEQSVFSFIRWDQQGNPIIAVYNFSEYGYEQYKVGVPEACDYMEVLNSDDQRFGGSNQVNTIVIKSEKGVYHGQPASIEIKLPPFGAVFIQPNNK
ncbi:1,4-alpha-glucan branching enzyme [Bacillus ectoiniformans]|uniref:1,4-alpha-glucan branching protein GlgB n=1 Tax=Bacillus ectoiniformans TaxID=1494429 RepID=UPI001959A802|nr:1,4-alpha-glucan branching protein GlgB [Bacillus ectoiniformans]MBM7649737.1 1,4-alpha-glucan branching enzyme [Bacillus ectoiniformans]